MAALLDAVVEAPPLVPPSSVIRGMDCGSSDEIFDPNLRGSSPNKSPTSALQNQNVDLLDEDVDWDEVMDNVLEPVAPEDSIISSHKPPAPVPLPATEPLTQTDRPLPRPPQPFVRPKFPDPVRDKSPIAGISHTSILRICFRIGELLNEGKRASLASQDVVFELFARVSYSSRESNTQTTTTTYPRIQHFQFIDLYKDQLPYPTGKLTGWKTDSQTDCQSRVFLSPSGSAGRRKKGEAKLCRCVCRLKKDKKAELGWALEVLTIRETDWEEIELTKRAVCRE
ncbi:hypothetical protein QBC47DRAFT_372079 [Echria macrotheca]|uniref:Uncharacterized protein n=1 Tax=Echria macrotheca TaxID=438768 RepID=A0AAJ0FFV6_9PEZI|nr:hypothetical protein QBC47DRAFT_372079 [Echria macrotheca]